MWRWEQKSAWGSLQVIDQGLDSARTPKIVHQLELSIVYPEIFQRLLSCVVVLCSGLWVSYLPSNLGLATY